MRGSAGRRHHIDLRLATAVGFETYASPIGRIGRRGIDRRSVGEARGRLRTQIHHEQVRIAALLQAHDHALAIRRETRRERHAGKIADDFAFAGLDSVQVDARVALAEFHVGDQLLVACGREPRRQHQIGALGQVTHIEAILIHQRQALDAPLLGSGLIDEHHAAVEIALLAGQALVDLVGNDVCNPPRVFRRREVLLAGELLARVHIPETEFRLQTSIGLEGHPAGHQGLRVDGLPVLELRRLVDVVDLFDEGRRIDRREQSAALEVVGNDLGHADADLAVPRRSRHKIRNRDRKRCKVTLRDNDPLRRLPEGAACSSPGQHTKRRHPGNNLPAAQAGRHVVQSIFVGHIVTSFVSCPRSPESNHLHVFRSVNTGAKYFHSSK